MDTTKYVFNLRDDKDIEDNISQLALLLLKFNREKSIYKYKFFLKIYSDNITFNNELGQITPSNEVDFFDKHNIPSCYISIYYNKRELTFSSKKAIRIYSNNIKFYKSRSGPFARGRVPLKIFNYLISV